MEYPQQTSEDSDTFISLCCKKQPSKDADNKPEIPLTLNDCYPKEVH